MTEHADLPPPIFIGGAGRSGTTLLRVMLDSHPHVACGPELKVTTPVLDLWGRLQGAYAPALQAYGVHATELNAAIRRLLLELVEPYRRAAGKRRIAEKTPHNVFVFAQLNQLFPDSPLLHVIRDGRDVVASLLRQNWRDADTGQPVAYTRDARAAAEYWVSAVEAGRQVARNVALRSRYLEVRYEDLVREPEPALRRVLDFVGEPWDPAVLRHHEHERNLAGESSAAQVAQPLYTHAIGRWRTDLSPADREAVKQAAGHTLIELGYAHDRSW